MQMTVKMVKRPKIKARVLLVDTAGGALIYVRRLTTGN
jgi:hypothetical protein